nr:ISKra4 family transposase [uncultured Desulfobacter sp.]
MNPAVSLSAVEHLPSPVIDPGQKCYDDIVNFLNSKENHSVKLSDLEQELEKRGRELMRILLQEHLDKLGPSHCEEPVCGADGIVRPKVRPQDRKIETVFGTVSESRAGYGNKGVASLHPLDARLNLPPELYSLELRRRVAENASKSSFDETVETIKKTTGADIPKRQVEELTQRAARDFDAFYEIRQCSPADETVTGPILVITTDGKGVVMHEQDLREQTRKAARKRKPQMESRLSKGEKKNAKRMATVAAVYTIDTFKRTPQDLLPGNDKSNTKTSPHPEQKRVWASLEKSAEQVIASAFSEASHRDPNHEKHWVALVDGENQQLRILKRMAKRQNVALTIIVDIIHVIEYLWKAGRAFHPKSGPELEKWVQYRLAKVLDGKAGLMAGGMRRSATLKKFTGKQRKPVEACATYLKNKAPYLEYHHYLDLGLPIATGVIEGACRHLVKDRMDITGAKWRLSSAEAVLRLRALRSSNDFDEYWNFHEACEYERNHRALYQHGEVPATKLPKPSPKRRGHLKVIK